VTATVNSGYTFANWTASGVVVSSSASYTFTLNNNRSLVANFVSGSVGCPSVYDGTYMGQFVYVYYKKGADGNYSPVQDSFQLTLTLKCLATANGSTTLQVTSANCSDPNFGCQVSGCTPLFGLSAAALPASPPTTPFNLSQAGQGIVIFFPNGASITTQNIAGALNVTTGGRILSNSLDPSIQNNTWVGMGGNFPSSSVPPGGPVTQFKSWSLVKSAL
jgi:hypothetical protein